MVIPNPASLYFHIPFCTKKCPYCHFYIVPERAVFKNIFTEAIAIEWEKRLPLLEHKEIVSIYFGGGTPTLFAPDGIATLLDLIRSSKIRLAEDCEITIEANPEECSKERFAQLYKLGINRLSIGIQSFDDRSLSILGRTHNAKQAKKAIVEAAHAGFRNISIDLMYELPEQTEASWEYTLNQAGSLPITHLSLYNLTIEPSTSFYKKKDTLALPSPNTNLKLLQKAIFQLEQMELKRYEISAFAKKGHQSRHNIGYWTYRPFLGFGPSAVSYWEGERFRNIANIQRWANALKTQKSPVDFRERLATLRDLKEQLVIRLRLFEGVDLAQLPTLPLETNASIDKWIKHGYLTKRGSHLQLTERGSLFYDSIASDLI
ncbi:MAG TPA: radical SAM family heme chaperone HemW [Chlamydiales bacterium]|nr:radical SAM family heme chaperone HemW [Chlamydiales bacterium]